MSDLVQRPEDELIDALEFLANERLILEFWFSGKSSIEDDLDIIFDYPHIQWNKIAPETIMTDAYINFYNLYTMITSPKFRTPENNNHISIDIFEQSNIWKKIPPLAKALKEAVEAELSKK